MGQQETRTLVTVCAEVAVKNIMEKVSGTQKCQKKHEVATVASTFPLSFCNFHLFNRECTNLVAEKGYE